LGFCKVAAEILKKLNLKRFEDRIKKKRKGGNAGVAQKNFDFRGRPELRGRNSPMPKNKTQAKKRGGITLRGF